MINGKKKLVSSFHCIENETVKQMSQNRNNIRNKNETINIKALALKVLQGRSSLKNETFPETLLKQDDKTSETNAKQNKAVCETKSLENLLYNFEERIAIMMFDGGLTEREATNQAFLDVIQNTKENNFLIPYE